MSVDLTIKQTKRNWEQNISYIIFWEAFYSPLSFVSDRLRLMHISFLNCICDLPDGVFSLRLILIFLIYCKLIVGMVCGNLVGLMLFVKIKGLCQWLSQDFNHRMHLGDKSAIQPLRVPHFYFYFYHKINFIFKRNFISFFNIKIYFLMVNTIMDKSTRFTANVNFNDDIGQKTSYFKNKNENPPKVKGCNLNFSLK